MKVVEFNEENIIINVKREKRRKALLVAIFLLVAIISILLISIIGSFNFYRNMANNAMLFVLGIALAVCVSGTVFTFVKGSIKRESLLCGCVCLVLGGILYYNFTGAINESDFFPGLENNPTLGLLAVAAFHLVYSIVIFAMTMFINHCAKKISLKKQKACSNL